MQALGRKLLAYQWEDGKKSVTKPDTSHSLTMCTCLLGLELSTACIGQQHAW